MLKYLAAIMLMMGVLTAGTAFAQSETDDVPPGTKGSGLITLQQIVDDLQFFRIERNGIFVHFVLPQGWELVEQGVDPATGQMAENASAYTLLSQSPQHAPDEPTDFIFELSIFEKGLMDELPADTPQEERNAGIQLWNFLNERISINLRGGLTCRTARNEIEAKPYGTDSPQREPTFFVPLAYDTPTGAELYTFTSFTGDKVWMMRFLVAEDQIDNYGALIALILDNSFGMTQAELKEAQTKK